MFPDRAKKNPNRLYHSAPMTSAHLMGRGKSWGLFSVDLPGELGNLSLHACCFCTAAVEAGPGRKRMNGRGGASVCTRYGIVNIPRSEERRVGQTARIWV